MSLREQMLADVWTVLFKTGELAVDKRLGDKLVSIIEDDEQLAKYRQQGICTGTLLLYVPLNGEKGLGYMPVAGDSILYGARKYEVELCSCSGGVIKLVLTQPRTGGGF